MIIGGRSSSRDSTYLSAPVYIYINTTMLSANFNTFYNMDDEIKKESSEQTPNCTITKGSHFPMVVDIKAAAMGNCR